MTQVPEEPAHPLIEGPPVPESTAVPGRTHGKLVTFAIRLFQETLHDDIDDLGAMLAYYAVLALFPLIVFVVMLSLLVLPSGVIEQGLHMAAEAVPASARVLVLERAESLVHAANPGFAILSSAFALWGASRGACALGLVLNTLHQKKETRPWWKRQLIALAVTAGVALMMIVALALLVGGPIVGHWLIDRFGLGDTFDLVWSIGRWAGAGLLVMIVWAVLYKFLPDTRPPFKIFTWGATVGVLLWLGISYLFGLYLSHFASYEATYGALGGAVIFLTWLWLSSITLLFGAEINDVIRDLKRERIELARRHALDHDGG